MAEQKPKAKPKPPPKGTGTEGYGGGGTVDTGTESPPKEQTKAEKREQKQLKQRAERWVDNYQENTRGGAPVSVEFVMAALEQGLTLKDIGLLAHTQLLAGPGTGPAWGSSEVLDYFTDNPELISQLLDSAQLAKEAPEDYGTWKLENPEGTLQEFHDAWWAPQKAKFAIPGVLDAYMAGTEKSKWIAEGNDPAQWYNYKARQRMEGKTQAPTGPSFIGGFDVDQFNALGTRDLGSLATAAQEMFQAKQQKEYAQTFNEDYFSPDQVESDI